MFRGLVAGRIFASWGHGIFVNGVRVLWVPGGLLRSNGGNRTTFIKGNAGRRVRMSGTLAITYARGTVNRYCFVGVHRRNWVILEGWVHVLRG